DVPLGPHGFEPAGGSLDLRRGGGGALEGQGHAASWGMGTGGDGCRPFVLGTFVPFRYDAVFPLESRRGTIPATPPSAARSGEELPTPMPKSTGRKPEQKGGAVRLARTLTAFTLLGVVLSAQPARAD